MGSFMMYAKGSAIAAGVISLVVGISYLAADTNRRESQARGAVGTALEIAAGEDGLLDDSEKVSFLRAFNLPAVIQKGQNLSFDYNRGNTNVYLVSQDNSSTFLGSLSLDVVNRYIESGSR